MNRSAPRSIDQVGRLHAMYAKALLVSPAASPGAAGV
jgi:hypothetical protein